MTLAVRTPNWIGDCIMVQPALSALRRVYAKDQVLLVTRGQLAQLFSPPLISPEEAFTVVTLPAGSGWRSEFQALRPLRKSHARRGLLFTNSFVSALSFRMGGVSHLTGYSRDCRGMMLRNAIPWPGKREHQVDAYMDLAASELGFKAEHGIRPELNISGVAVENARKRLHEMGVYEGVPWIGISPCAAYGPAKEWPHDLQMGLIRVLQNRIPGALVILFGGPGDFNRLDLLASGTSGRVINLAASMSLTESIAAVSLCSAFVSNDSGMMHVASALRVPLVALFGPTPPHRAHPGGGDDTVVIHHPVDCAPCSKRICDHHSCMRAITIDEVALGVEQCLWEKDSGRQ